VGLFLVGRVLIGSVEEVDGALTLFCQVEYPRLVMMLSLHTGERAVAEELAQDTLVRVHEHWGRVRGMSNPSGWAYSVGLNLSRSWWRRRHAERRALARLGRPAVEATSSEPADAVALRAAVASLPVRQRTALVLRYFADLSIAETAAHMHCAEGTVKSLTSQALAALRPRFEEIDDA
jgi:RNA polymerase sigma-70 factor (ECF subfamily)